MSQRMNPEIKARWVRALRSGEYRQGKGSLASLASPWSDGTMEYCCLGVLCDLAVKDGIIQILPEKGGPSLWFGLPNPPVAELLEIPGEPGYRSSSTVLPNAVKDWAGLVDYNPDIALACTCPPEELALHCECYSAHGPHDLASINDDTDVGFEGIADLIEDQL